MPFGCARTASFLVKRQLHFVFITIARTVAQIWKG
nr:MAG TPA: hypothetical protein [Caudoviricetes sp.]